MTAQKQPFVVGLLIGAVVFAAIVVAAFAVLWNDWSGESGSGLSDAFKYDLQKYYAIDPALFRYHQVAEIPVAMRDLRAIAVGTNDQILVAGDTMIHVFSPFSLQEQPAAQDGEPNNGNEQAAQFKEIALTGEPYSLTVGNAEHVAPGRIYVGMWDHVEVFDADGSRAASWPTSGIITSLAAAEKDVFVADAKAKIVRRFDADGKELGQIGRYPESHGTHVFVIPSPYFAIAMSPDGLLRVVNPGAHRIEAYTLDGHMELSWGEAGERILAFCGCCNPSYIAVLPDGRIVTSEKGLPRVKVYDVEGKFEGVVVGPETLLSSPSSAVETREDHRLHPVPVAADSRGRILVLDSAARCVRVYVENSK